MGYLLSGVGWGHAESRFFVIALSGEEGENGNENVVEVDEGGGAQRKWK